MKGALLEKDGEGKGNPSFSRALPFYITLYLTLITTVVMAGVAFLDAEWKDYAPALEFLRGLWFGSLLPLSAKYLGQKVRGPSQ